MKQRKFNAIFGAIIIPSGCGVAFLMVHYRVLTDTIFNTIPVIMVALGFIALFSIPLTKKDEEVP